MSGCCATAGQFLQIVKNPLSRGLSLGEYFTFKHQTKWVSAYETGVGLSLYFMLPLHFWAQSYFYLYDLNLKTHVALLYTVLAVTLIFSLSALADWGMWYLVVGKNCCCMPFCLPIMALMQFLMLCMAFFNLIPVFFMFGGGVPAMDVGLAILFGICQVLPWVAITPGCYALFKLWQERRAKGFDEAAETRKMLPK